jgi:hypothetical protein
MSKITKDVAKAKRIIIDLKVEAHLNRDSTKRSREEMEYLYTVQTLCESILSQIAVMELTIPESLAKPE